MYERTIRLAHVMLSYHRVGRAVQRGSGASNKDDAARAHVNAVYEALLTKHRHAGDWGGRRTSSTIPVAAIRRYRPSRPPGQLASEKRVDEGRVVRVQGAVHAGRLVDRVQSVREHPWGRKQNDGAR